MWVIWKVEINQLILEIGIRIKGIKIIFGGINKI